MTPTVGVLVELGPHGLGLRGNQLLGVARTLSEHVVLLVLGPSGTRDSLRAPHWVVGPVELIECSSGQTNEVAKVVVDLVDEHGLDLLLTQGELLEDVLALVAAVSGGTALCSCARVDRVAEDWIVGVEPDRRFLRDMRSPILLEYRIPTCQLLCCSAGPLLLGSADAEHLGERPEPRIRSTVGHVSSLVTQSETELVPHRVELGSALVVVAGGRGLKGPEGFGMIEDLAREFRSGAVAATRAVTDAHWRPHAEQVGQTSRTVAPLLYIGVGVSGAIQHIAGMRQSRLIIAVNKDPEAPLVRLADVAIIGDAFQVVPALIEALRAARVQA